MGDDGHQAHQHGAEEAKQALEGAAEFDGPSAKLGQRRRLARSLAIVAAVGLGHLFEQLGDVAARACDPRSSIAHGAVDKPGADRVDPLHPRQVDGERIGGASISRWIEPARAMVNAPLGAKTWFSVPGSAAEAIRRRHACKAWVGQASGL
jgi:hypothetical protein